MKYPNLDLEFAIPVTIGGGKVSFDPDGVMRLVLFDPEDQIVVMEKRVPLDDEPVREHKEGCCTNSDGTWSESQECDASCWCHIPIEPVTAVDIARSMEIPEEVVEAPQPYCNCRERRGLWEEGKTAPACPIHGIELLPGLNIPEEPPTYDPRAAGTVYPSQPVAKAQTYVLHGLGKTQFGDAASNRCEACGCLVGDKIQHDVWHSKTRSQV